MVGGFSGIRMPGKPPMKECLIWLTEALGENLDVLKKAVDSALAYNTMPERCHAYRKNIPFDRIVALANDLLNTKD